MVGVLEVSDTKPSAGYKPWGNLPKSPFHPRYTKAEIDKMSDCTRIQKGIPLDKDIKKEKNDE